MVVPPHLNREQKELYEQLADPLTARVTDLFNVNYEILLQLFGRFFAHTTETDAQLKVLADASVALMMQVIKPLGSLITALPPGPAYGGRTAGPSFELFYESDYLMPHQHAAWTLLAERLDAAAWLCSELCAGRGTALAAQLEPVLDAIRQTNITEKMMLGGPIKFNDKGQVEGIGSACGQNLNLLPTVVLPKEAATAKPVFPSPGYKRA